MDFRKTDSKHKRLQHYQQHMALYLIQRQMQIWNAPSGGGGMSMAGLANRERSRYAVWRHEEYISLDNAADWLDQSVGPRKWAGVARSPDVH